MAVFALTSGNEKWTIFNRVNQLDEATVARIAGLNKAADGKSYICPVCGHGCHGDGIKQQCRNSRRPHFYCFGGCGGVDYSNADIICAAAGIDITNKAAVAEYLESVFPDWKGTNPFSFTGNELARTENNEADNEADNEAVKDWAKMYRWLEWQKPLSSWLKIGERWRGLTYDVLRPKLAPYRKALYHPELWLNDKRPAMLFPYNNNLSKSPAQAKAQAGDAFQGDARGFFWRSLVDERRGFSRGFKFAPYVVSTLKFGGGAVNFVFEGIVDALSVKQAVKDATGNYEWLKEVGLLATGSAMYAQKFIDWVAASFDKLKDKPAFFFVADNDEAGMMSARKIAKALRAKGFAAMMSPFTSPDNPKLDANSALQEYGAKRLFDALAKWKSEAGSVGNE